MTVRVSSYKRKDGTQVRQHTRTDPDFPELKFNKKDLDNIDFSKSLQKKSNDPEYMSLIKQAKKAEKERKPHSKDIDEAEENQNTYKLSKTGYERWNRNKARSDLEGIDTKKRKQKVDLMFTSLGNGITVVDRNRQENGDYKKVAHINSARKITWYDKKLPLSTKKEIENFAKRNNPPISATQKQKVFNKYPSDFEITGLRRELEYKDFTPKAKAGIKKFSALSSDDMRKYGDKFRKETGITPVNNYKISYYSWMQDNIKQTKESKKPSKTTSGSKIPASEVKIIWAEGYTGMPANEGLTFSGSNSIQKTNGYLEWASQFVTGEGYDKHKIKITWADGETYEGRWDVMKNGEDTNISKHIKDWFIYLMKQSDTTAKEKKEMETFLKKYSLPEQSIKYVNKTADAKAKKHFAKTTGEVISNKEMNDLAGNFNKSAGKENVLKQNLAQFSGTEQYHHLSYLKRLKSTDGVKYLADEAQAYWLIDLIESYQPRLMAKGQDFQTWTITVKNDEGVVKATDGNGKVLASQKIPYTDFPLSSQKLYVSNGVLMLPSEY